MTWPIKKIGEIFNRITDSVLSKNYPDKGFYFVGLENIESGSGNIHGVKPVLGKFIRSSKTIFKKGDVLYGKLRPNLNKVWLAECDGICSTDIWVLRARPMQIIPFLLAVLLRQSQIVNQVSAGMSGVNLPRANKNAFDNIAISLPLLEIQKKIVERLGTIQETQKLNDRLIEKTDELFQSVLHRELDVKGKDWKVEKLGDIMKPQYGYTAAAEDAGEYRLVRITDIADDGMVRDENKKYASVDKEIAKQYLLKDGDLLLARTGATFGKILYFSNKERSIFASFLIRLNPDASVVDPRYLWLFSRSASYWRQARSLMTGSGQPQFNANKITKLKISLPPLTAQKQIIAKLDAVQQYKAQLLAQKAKLKELFDSVLAKSMKGEMD